MEAWASFSSSVSAAASRVPSSSSTTAEELAVGSGMTSVAGCPPQAVSKKATTKKGEINLLSSKGANYHGVESGAALKGTRKGTHQITTERNDDKSNSAGIA